MLAQKIRKSGLETVKNCRYCALRCTWHRFTIEVPTSSCTPHACCAACPQGAAVLNPPIGHDSFEFLSCSGECLPADVPHSRGPSKINGATAHASPEPDGASNVPVFKTFLQPVSTFCRRTTVRKQSLIFSAALLRTNQFQPCERMSGRYLFGLVLKASHFNR